MNSVEWATWLIGACYVIAFLLLSAQASKEAGRSVWLFGQGSHDQRLPALLFRLAFAGAVIWSPIAYVSGFSGRWTILPESATLDVAGNVLAAMGAAIAIASQTYMGRSWRIGAAEGELGDIVDNGPFALSRNPVFVGQVILFLGLALSISDVAHMAMLAGILIAVRVQVGIEERVLTESVGDAYRSYCKRVRRWL